MPSPLHRETIEAKPKKIHKARSWRDTVGLAKRPDLQRALAEILTYIQAGRPLPSRFYRSSQTPDDLLAREGIMHLHLGHSGTRELLYLKQYPQDIVLLEVSDHSHFTTLPAGQILHVVHDRKMQQWEADKDREMADELAAKAQAKADRNQDFRARLGLRNEGALMRHYLDMVRETDRV